MRTIGMMAGDVLVPSVAAAQPYDGGWHMMDGWYGSGYGILMWLFWVAVIVLLVYVITKAAPFGGSGGGETPMDILKKRYARGEITREEFERMKQDLK